MKISYNSWPVLMFADRQLWNQHHSEWKSIIQNKIKDGGLSKEDQGVIWTESQLTVHGIMLDKQIYMMSNTFLDMVYRNEEKLTDLLNDAPGMEDESAANCILASFSGNVIVSHVIDNNRHQIIATNKEGEIIHSMVYHSDIKKINIVFTMNEDDAVKIMSAAKKIILFKKFASVETEIIKAKTKQKSEISGKEKFFNDLGIDVTLLDSRWYREIIREEGFKVRGHFRLQPYKNDDGTWSRKLIYIKEFEKHGYHRKAFIETKNDAN